MIFFLLFTLVLSKPIVIERKNQIDEKHLHQNYSNILNDVDPDLIISKNQLPHSSKYVLIDITPCGRSIITLLYDETTIEKKGSYVVVSTDSGDTFKTYEKAQFDDEFEIDYFEISSRYINLISYRKNKLYVFTHQFVLLYKTKIGKKVEKFFNHPILDTFIAALTTDRTLLLSVDGGTTWQTRGSNVLDFAWVPNVSSEYHIIAESTSNISMLYLQNANNPNYNYLLKKNAIKLISQEMNNFVLFKYKNKVHVAHIMLYYYMPRLYIPGFADITDFSIVYRYKDEIMIAVTFSDGNTNLYQGSFQTFRFVRILNKIRSSKSPTEDNRCYDVTYYPRLPGFLLANAQDFDTYSGYSTIISFNHGVNWKLVKVGIFQDGKPLEECLPPSCKFLLHFDCGYHDYLKHNLQQSSLAPYILASLAEYTINGTKNLAHFISTDSGYSWKMTIKGPYMPGMINEGGIIFGTPTYSKNLMYTMDEGKTWKTFKSDFGEHIIVEIGETNLSRTSYKVIGGSWFSWFIVKLDFSKILKNECVKNDYEIIKPSTSSVSHCFMGQKYLLYRKKQSSVCKNVLEKFEPVMNSSCACTAEDFGCNYGFKMLKGQCIEDKEAEKIYPIHEYCYLGSVILKSAGQAGIAYDKCEKQHYNLDYQYEICGLARPDNFISIMKGNKLSFYTYRYDKFRDVVLRNTFRFPSAIGKYTIDTKNSCLYYLSSDKEIRKSCWGYIEESEELTDTIYVVESSVLHLDYDIVGSNLVYTSSEGINIKSVKNGKTKTFSNENTCDASFIRVVSEKGQILLGQHQANVLNVISFNGSLISSISFRSTLLNGAYDAVNDKIYALTVDGLYFINGKNAIKYPFKIPENVTDFSIFNGKLVFISRNSMYYDEKVYPHTALRGMYVKNSTAYNITLCSDLVCSDLCIPQTDGNVACDCPNQMELSKGRCVCKKDFPNCLQCKENEFDCGAGECISYLKKCDGYIDCTSQKDEIGCKFTCLPMQFACKNEEKCLEVTSICDGIRDCSMGEDEVNCPVYVNCTDQEFACGNQLCIPKDKVCNDINDCGDFTDEYNCKKRVCNNDQFQCNDGTCIPDEYVCNNVLDCSEWEDEKGCHIKPVYNETCEYLCYNGSCIEIIQVCDRVAQCPDGEDELYCSYPNECADGYVSCPYSSGCLLPTEVCDGKSDCFYSYDERFCRNEIKCNPPFTFSCKNGYQCIPTNRYCNGLKQCDDGSDEPQNCKLLNQVTSVYAYQMNSANISVSWWLRNFVESTTYVIALYDLNSTKSIKTYESSTTSLNISIPSMCVTYGITVQIKNSPFSISTISYRPIIMIIEAPKDVVKNSRYLSWKEYELKCMSRIYYIECVSGNTVVLRNFTRKTSFIVPSSGTCYVRACPKMAVGPFCSSPVQATTSNSVVVKLSLEIFFGILLFAGLIGGGIMVYRKYGYKIKRRYTSIRDSVHTTLDYRNSIEQLSSDDEVIDAAIIP